MKKLTQHLTLISILAAAGLFLAACGGDSAPPAAGERNDGIRTINLTGNDQMKFNQNRIIASPGEQLRIEFRNVGRMPKDTMGHNWVLFDLIEDAQLNQLLMDAARNRPNYLPSDQSRILAKTSILGPGESESLLIHAPSTPGEYRYICTFPGHSVLMRGVLVVR